MADFATWEFNNDATEQINLICYSCSNCGFTAREDEIKNLFETKCPECEV